MRSEAPANSQPNTDLTDQIEVVVDPDAEPGNVLDALAELLIDLAEREARDCVPPGQTEG
jgi:hypothetical protein